MDPISNTAAAAVGRDDTAAGGGNDIVRNVVAPQPVEALVFDDVPPPPMTFVTQRTTTTVVQQQQQPVVVVVQQQQPQQQSPPTASSFGIPQPPPQATPATAANPLLAPSSSSAAASPATAGLPPSSSSLGGGILRNGGGEFNPFSYNNIGGGSSSSRQQYRPPSSPPPLPQQRPSTGGASLSGNLAGVVFINNTAASSLTTTPTTATAPAQQHNAINQMQTAGSDSAAVAAAATATTTSSTAAANPPPPRRVSIQTGAGAETIITTAAVGGPSPPTPPPASASTSAAGLPPRPMTTTTTTNGPNSNTNDYGGGPNGTMADYYYSRSHSAAAGGVSVGGLEFIDDPNRFEIKCVEEKESERLARAALYRMRRQRGMKKARLGTTMLNRGTGVAPGRGDNNQHDENAAAGGGGDDHDDDDGGVYSSSSGSSKESILTDYTDETDSEDSDCLDLRNPAVNIQYPRRAVRVDMHQTLAIMAKGPAAMFVNRNGDEMAIVEEDEAEDDDDSNDDAAVDPKAYRSADAGERKQKRTVSKVPLEAIERSKESWLYQVPMRAVVLEQSSFFVFAPFNVGRIIFYNVLSHRHYEMFLFLVIMANCIFIATETPRVSHLDKPAYQFFTEYIFAIFFSLEALLKLFVFGGFFHKKAYFRQPMNVLDAMVVGFAWAAIFGEYFGNYTPFRIVRLLQCLRIIHIKKELNIVIGTIHKAIAPLVGVLGAMCLALWFFALFAVQLWMGQFSKRCFHTVTWEVLDSRGCSSDYLAEHTAGTPQSVYWGRYCPADYACRRIEDVALLGAINSTVAQSLQLQQGYLHFDNLGASLLAMFNVFTFDHWASMLMDRTFDVMSMFTFFFFFAVVGIVSYWVPALSIAIVVTKMREARDRHDEKQLKTFEAIKSDHMLTHTVRSRIPRPVSVILRMDEEAAAANGNADDANGNRNGNGGTNRNSRMMRAGSAGRRSADTSRRAREGRAGSAGGGARRPNNNNNNGRATPINPMALPERDPGAFSEGGPNRFRTVGRAVTPWEDGRVAVPISPSRRSMAANAAAEGAADGSAANNTDAAAAGPAAAAPLSDQGAARGPSRSGGSSPNGRRSGSPAGESTATNPNTTTLLRATTIGVTSAANNNNTSAFDANNHNHSSTTTAAVAPRERRSKTRTLTINKNTTVPLNERQRAKEEERTRKTIFAKKAAFIPSRVSSLLTVEQNLQLRLAFYEHFGTVRQTVLEDEARILPAASEAGNVAYKTRVLGGDIGPHTFAGTNAVASINNRTALLKTTSHFGPLLRGTAGGNGGGGGDDGNYTNNNNLLGNGFVESAMNSVYGGGPNSRAQSRASSVNNSPSRMGGGGRPMTGGTMGASAAGFSIAGNLFSTTSQQEQPYSPTEASGNGGGVVVSRTTSLDASLAGGINANNGAATAIGRTRTAELNRTLNSTEAASYAKGRGLRNTFTLSRSGAGAVPAPMAASSFRNTNNNNTAVVGSRSTSAMGMMNRSVGNVSFAASNTSNSNTAAAIAAEEIVGDADPILVQDPEGGDVMSAMKVGNGIVEAWDVIRNTVHKFTEGYPRVISLYILAQKKVDKMERIPAEFQPSAIRSLLKRRAYATGGIGGNGGINASGNNNARGGGRNNKKKGLALSEDDAMNAYYESLLDEDHIEMTPLEVATRIRDYARPTWFSYLVSLCVIIDVAFLGVKHANMNGDLFQAVDVITFICNTIYAFELFLRLVGLGFTLWFSDWLNWFDLCVVVFSYIEFGFNGTVAVSGFRALRMLRVGKLLPSAHVRHICRVYLNAVAYLASVTVILILYLFMTVLIGMQILYGKYDDLPNPSTAIPRSNFDSFLSALYSIMQTITRDDWTVLNYNSMSATTWGMAFFFMGVLLVGYLLIIPLYVASFVLVFEEDDHGDGAPNTIGLVLVDTQNEYYTYIHAVNARKAIEESNNYTRNGGKLAGRMNNVVPLYRDDALALYNPAVRPKEIIRVNGTFSHRVATSRREARHYAEQRVRRAENMLSTMYGGGGGHNGTAYYNSTSSMMMQRRGTTTSNGTVGPTMQQYTNRAAAAAAPSFSATLAHSLGMAPALMMQSTAGGVAVGSGSAMMTMGGGGGGGYGFSSTTLYGGGGSGTTNRNIPSRAGNSTSIFAGTVQSRLAVPDGDAVLFPPMESEGDTVEMTYVNANTDAATTRASAPTATITINADGTTTTTANPSPPPPPSKPLRRVIASMITGIDDGDNAEEGGNIALAPALPAPPGRPQRTAEDIRDAHREVIRVRKAKQAVLSEVRRFVDAQVIAAVQPTANLLSDTIAQLWSAGMLLQVTLEEISEPSPLTGRPSWDIMVEELEDAQAVLDLQVGEEQVGRGGNAIVVGALMSGRVIKQREFTWQDRSLFLLAPNNKIRIFFMDIVESLWFEVLSFAMVICSAIILSIYDPRYPDNGGDGSSNRITVLNGFDNFFTVIFTIEVVMRIIAQGFIWRPVTTFMWSGWNIIDLAVAVISILSWIGSPVGVHARYIKVIRLFRILRITSLFAHMRNLRVISLTILRAIPSLLVALFLLAFNLLVWAVIALPVYMGRMSYCTNSAVTNFFDCYGPYNVSSAAAPLVYETLEAEWVSLPRNFDNAGNALLAMVEVSTGEWWVDLMYQAVDSTSRETAGQRDYEPTKGLFFVAFVIITNFALMKILAGIIMTNYNIVRRQADSAYLMTRPQRDWCNAQRILLSVSAKRVRKPLENFVSRFLFQVVESIYFRLAILGVIFANEIFISLEHWDMNSRYTDACRISNFIFVAIYWAIMIVQLIAHGPYHYVLASRWHLFDAVLNILVMVEIIVSQSKGDTDAAAKGLYINFNIFRLLKLVELAGLAKEVAPSERRMKGFVAKQINGIRIAILALWFSIPAFLALAFILLFIFVAFAIIGVHAFATLDSGIIIDSVRYPNFNNFPNALILGFRMIGGEDWDRVMRDAMHDVTSNNCHDENGHNCGSYVAPLFFVPLVFMFAFIFVYITVSIVLENYEALLFIEGKSAESTLTNMAEFSRLWQKYDPDATELIPTERLPSLLEDLKPHRGILRASDRQEVLRKVAEYHIPDHDGFVNFTEVMMPVLRAATGIAFTTNQLKQQHEGWKRYCGALRLMPVSRLRGSTCTADQFLLASYTRSVFQRRMGRLYVQKRLYERHVDGRRECLARQLRPCDYGYNGKRFGAPTETAEVIASSQVDVTAVLVPPAPIVSAFTERAVEHYRAAIEGRQPRYIAVDHAENLLLGRAAPSADNSVAAIPIDLPPAAGAGDAPSAALAPIGASPVRNPLAARRQQAEAEVEELVRIGRRPTQSLLIEAGLKRPSEGDARSLPITVEAKQRHAALKRENPRRASRFVIAARQEKDTMDARGEDEFDEQGRPVVRTFAQYEYRSELSPEDAVSPSTAQRARKKNKAIRYPPTAAEMEDSQGGQYPHHHLGGGAAADGSMSGANAFADALDEEESDEEDGEVLERLTRIEAEYLTQMKQIAAAEELALQQQQQQASGINTPTRNTSTTSSPLSSPRTRLARQSKEYQMRFPAKYTAAASSSSRRFGPDVPEAIRRNLNQEEKMHRDEMLRMIKKSSGAQVPLNAHLPLGSDVSSYEAVVAATTGNVFQWGRLEAFKKGQREGNNNNSVSNAAASLSAASFADGSQ